MTAIPVRAPSVRLRRASTVLLGLAAALLLVDVVAVVSTGGFADSPLDPLTYQVAQVALLVAGAVLLRDPRHAGLGRLLIGTAGVGALTDLTGTLTAVGPAEFLYAFANGLYVALIVHLLVRWPDRRVHGALSRALVVAAYAVPVLLTAVWELTWSPRWWEGDERNRAWITLVPARDFSAAAWQVQQIILIALIGALVALVVVRTAGSQGARRGALAPVALVAVVLAATDVVRIGVALGATIEIDLNVAQNLALLAIPIAVLVAVVRAPSGVDVPDQPGRRVHLDDAARDRYHLGLAGVAAAIVIAIALVVAISSDHWPDAPSSVQPGPALQAP